MPGGNSGSGNLITDGTTSTFNVTFDRPMVVNTARPANRPRPVVHPGHVLSIMGPAGRSPARSSSHQTSARQIPAATPTSPGDLTRR